MLRVPLILAAALLPACAAPESTSAWGAGVTLRPGWARVGQALHAAAVDPVTWIPVAGAGLLSIDDVDEDIGEWAAEKTPLFGSRDGADRYSTDVRKALVGLSIVSSLATFSGEELDDALPAKLKGLALRQATVATSRLATNELKDAIGRERPDDFPQEPVPAFDLEGKYLLGNWGGSRWKLKEEGVNFNVLGIMDGVNNFHGGEARGAFALYLMNVSVSIETEKLLGYKGGEFFAAFQYGNRIASKPEYVGSYWGFDGIDAEVMQL